MLGCEYNPEKEVSDDAITESQTNNSVILKWKWEDSFTDKQKKTHQKWLSTVFKASQSKLGRYPLQAITFHLHHSKNNHSPVSFGYASRKKNTQVHLYVSNSYTLNELLNDWTAPHEISHLAIPFIGKKDMWFTEGFATFFSRQIMLEMGIYTPSELTEIYRRKLNKIKSLKSTTSTFIAVSDSLLQHHAFGELYWGGSSFFFLIDNALRTKGTSFSNVIKSYQSQNRKIDRSIDELVQSFDLIIGTPICQQLLKEYRTEPAVKIREKLNL